MNKFSIWSWLIVIFLLTNYFGWTTIPWMLLKIVAYATGFIWLWGIIVGTIIVIINNTK